jgi:hypothetical protein
MRTDNLGFCDENVASMEFSISSLKVINAVCDTLKPARDKFEDIHPDEDVMNGIV